MKKISVLAFTAFYLNINAFAKDNIDILLNSFKSVDNVCKIELFYKSVNKLTTGITYTCDSSNRESTLIAQVKSIGLWYEHVDIALVKILAEAKKRGFREIHMIDHDEIIVSRY